VAARVRACELRGHFSSMGFFLLWCVTTDSHIVDVQFACPASPSGFDKVTFQSIQLYEN